MEVICKKRQQNFIRNHFFTSKRFFIVNEIYFKIRNLLHLIDLNEIFLIKPSEFKISHLVKSFDGKCLKLTKFQRCRKAHSFHAIKDIYPKVKTQF